MRPIMILPALLLATLANRCDMNKSAIWLDNASSVHQLTFAVAQQRGGSMPVDDLKFFAVRTCYVSNEPRVTFWQIRGNPPRGEAPTRIVYGTSPKRFESEVTARPLTPGCYEGMISGDGVSASVRFTVGHDSGVVQQTMPGSMQPSDERRAVRPR
jgi:hypothetical protein